jgi:predicted transcriptional regulator
MMARKKSDILTPAEQRVMDAIWTLERGTISDVHAIVSRTVPSAYTTVMTVLKVLDGKGYVLAHREGRALVYEAAVSRQTAQSQALLHVVGQFFAGSRTALAQHLLRQEDMSRAELKSLEEMVQNAIAAREFKGE